jgi:hypothetical protein
MRDKKKTIMKGKQMKKINKEKGDKLGHNCAKLGSSISEEGWVKFCDGYASNFMLDRVNW